MERGLAQAEAHFMYRLQTVGGFGGKSDQLNAYNVFRGDPGFFAGGPRAVPRGHAANRSAPPRANTCRSIARVCSASFRAARPRSPSPAPSRWPSRDGGRSLAAAGRLARSRVSVFPRIVRHTLANGLKVRTVEHPGVPVVTFVMQINGGLGADPEGREGLASLTADMVDEGTGTLSAIDVSDALARIGAEYDVEVGADATMFTLTTLARFAGRGARLAVGHPDGAVDARIRLRARSPAAPGSAATAQGPAACGGRARVPAACCIRRTRTAISRSAATRRCARSRWTRSFGSTGRRFFRGVRRWSSRARCRTRNCWRLRGRCIRRVDAARKT